MIESEFTAVTWDDDLGYLAYADAEGGIKHFDLSGRYVRTIGSEGEGPGEFRSIDDVHIVDNQLVVLDARTRSWSLFDEDMAFVKRLQYPGEIYWGNFHVAGGDTVVLAEVETRIRDAVGYPLHLTTLGDPTTVVHFGSDRPEYVPDGPYPSMVPLSTMSAPGTVWWGDPTFLHLEEWSLDGRHLGTIAGSLPWFTGTVTAEEWMRTKIPKARMAHFGVDSNDRLWLMSEVTDPDWEDVEFVRAEIMGWEPKEGTTPEQLRDARLDVFDLSNMTHLGSFTWDEVHPMLTVVEGELAVSNVEYDEAMVPRVVIYRLQEVIGPRGGPVMTERTAAAALSSGLPTAARDRALAFALALGPKAGREGAPGCGDRCRGG